jgi:hypothetical protein
MGTFIWLLITTGVGYFIGQHYYGTVEHIGIISSGLGFLFGVITRLIVEGGGSGIADAAADSFDLFD